jgi:hypothetical protein
LLDQQLKDIIIASMKLLFAVLVFLAMGLVLGAGILMLQGGKPWLLIAGLVAYTLAFVRIGCLSH